MAIPQIHPTKIHDESFGGVTYHLEGELVPVLHIELSGTPIYFEHHVLLWKHPQVNISVKSLSGAFKRMLSGMPVFMTQAKGPGHIAFSRDGAGQILPIHLSRGQSLDVREHQFLAATDSINHPANYPGHSGSNSGFGGRITKGPLTPAFGAVCAYN